MEPERVLQLILYVVIIIAISALVFQLTRILGNVNSVLKDFKKVSVGIALFTSSPERIKQNISDLAILTVDKVIDRQIIRIRDTLKTNLISTIASFIATKK